MIEIVLLYKKKRLSALPIYEYFGFTIVAHKYFKNEGLNLWGFLRPPVTKIDKND